MIVTIPLVLVRGSKVGWFRREKMPAQVLSIEPNSGIVHICLYWDPPHLDWLPVEIGFIPILASTLEKSIIDVVGPRPVGNDWWRSLQEWRALNAEGSAGAFFLPPWEIRSMAWETVHDHQPAATRENLYLERAFPVRIGNENAFKGVRVSSYPRASPVPG